MKISSKILSAGLSAVMLLTAVPLTTVQSVQQTVRIF